MRISVLKFFSPEEKKIFDSKIIELEKSLILNENERQMNATCHFPCHHMVARTNAISEWISMSDRKGFRRRRTQFLAPNWPSARNLQKCHHFNEHNCVSAGCCWFQTQFSHRPSCFWPQTSEFARNFDSVKSQNSAPQLFPPKSAISSLFDGFDLMASDFEGYEALLDSSGLFWLVHTISQSALKIWWT